MRLNNDQLRAARLSLNTKDGFAISKAVIIEMIDELLELRARVCERVEAKLVVDVHLQDGDMILLTNQDKPTGNGLRRIRLEQPK